MGSLSLRTAIFLVLFVTVTVFTLFHGAIGYIENRYTVNKYATALFAQQQSAITAALTHKFSVQSALDNLLAETIGDMYALGGMPLVERNLLYQLRQFDQISATFFSTAQNEFAGYVKQEKYLHMVSNQETEFTIQFFQSDSLGNDGALANERKGFYATQRPWYQSALDQDSAGFSEVFTYHAYATLALPHSLPVYQPDGELLGVVGSNIFLGEFGGFLQQQMQPFSGVAIILDEKNRLIASSLDVSPLMAEENRSSMINASTSDNPFVNMAYTQAIAALDGPQTSVQGDFAEFELLDQEYKVASFEFADIPNLTWKLVLFMPEQAFQKSVNQLLWQIGLIMLLSLVIAGLLSLWVARGISNPIANLIAYFSKGTNDFSSVAMMPEDTFSLREVKKLRTSISQYHSKLGRYVDSVEKQFTENQRQLQQIKQLAKVTQSIDDKCLIIDQQGMLIWANQGFLQFMQLDASYLSTIHVTQLAHKDSAKKALLQRVYNQFVMRTKQALPFSLIESIDGKLHLEFRFFSINETEEEQILVLIRNISDRVEKEKELAIWKHIFDSTQIGIAVSLKNNQLLDMVNPAFAKMYKGEQSDFIGADIQNLYPDDAPKPPLEILREVNDKGGLTIEVENLRLDGTRFPALLTITLVSDNKGNPLGRVTLVSDISESRQLQRELFQSQKMHAIGSLAGGIVHDINNVLSSVMGNAELGLLTTKDTDIVEVEKCQQIYRSIINAAEKGSKLSQQVMAFSRMEEVHTHPVFMQKLLLESIELVNASLTSNIKINLDSSLKECDVIIGNESQLQQVVLNLLNNGVKAIGKSDRAEGVITLSAHVEDFNVLHMTVHDNGCGIPDSVKPYIFDPFYTTEAKEKGTGLGLAIVDRIVTSHGGKIDVSSEPGQGTQFDLWFNNVQSQHPDAVQSEDLVSCPDSSQHLVIVDDNQEILNIWRELLQLHEYKVTSFNKPMDALAFCQKHAEDIDCVITDYDMPTLSGEAFCQSMRETENDLKIIMVTGFSEVLSAEKISDLNIAKILYKPITINTLVKELRAVLGD